jgi:hypothetical protein
MRTLLFAALMTVFVTFPAVATPQHEMPKIPTASSSEGMHAKMIPFSFKYEEVPGGVQLTLVPDKPEQLEQFRAMVRQHVEQMKKGECSMMQEMMMKGMMKEMMGKTEESGESEHYGHQPGEKK